MPRNRFVFTAPIVLAIVIIGVFAIRSRGDNSANVDTTGPRNCPPVARADAVATKPATPVAIDVLANDTDPDGDPLVFQIRSATGGDATVEDGGTPADAADDRVLFTPTDPPKGDGTIDYQALDPDGAISEATVTVVINADGVLPAGVASEPVPASGKVSDRCDKSASTSTTDSTDTTVKSTTGTTTPDVVDVTGVAPSNSNGKSTKTSGRTTTTRKSTASTTKTTNPDAPGTTQTTRPSPPPTEPPTTGTTQPRTPPTTNGDCGPEPDPRKDPNGYDTWAHCTYGR